MPWRVALPPPAARLAQRLGRRLAPGLGRHEALPAPGSPPIVEEPLIQAGRRLREAREGQGLGLRQLALQTRISTAVLEAMERGWRDRLPEAAYLRTMLPLLEHQLNLPSGSLEGALPPEKDRPHGPRREPLLRRFTPGSIDVFTTWQGTVLYGVATVALIFAVNLQQQKLAARGLLSSRPIPPLADDAAANAEDADERLRMAFPDLRPLGRAAAGQGLARLRSEAAQERPDLSLGRLSLRLDAPTRVDLVGRGGDATGLNEARGTVALPVLPPFRLRLDPAPKADAVRWNGRPIPGNGGDYRYPPTELRPAPSAPRPNRAAMAP